MPNDAAAHPPAEGRGTGWDESVTDAEFLSNLATNDDVLTAQASARLRHIAARLASSSGRAAEPLPAECEGDGPFDSPWDAVWTYLDAESDGDMAPAVAIRAIRHHLLGHGATISERLASSGGRAAGEGEATDWSAFLRDVATNGGGDAWDSGGGDIWLSAASIDKLNTLADLLASRAPETPDDRCPIHATTESGAVTNWRCWLTKGHEGPCMIDTGGAASPPQERAR